MDDPAHMILTILMLMVPVIVPGFALSLALFPKKKALDTIERLGISFILGMIPTLFLYFGNKNFYLPITTETSLATIALITGVSLFVWNYRKGEVAVVVEKPAKKKRKKKKVVKEE